MTHLTNTGVSSRENEPENRAENLPNSRFIEDTDGSLGRALGEALKVLIQNGIRKRKQSQTDFLKPHRDALCRLKQTGVSYAEIAARLSQEMGFVISDKAVANVVGSGRSGKRRSRRTAAATTSTPRQVSAGGQAHGDPGEHTT